MSERRTARPMKAGGRGDVAESIRSVKDAPPIGGPGAHQDAVVAGLLKVRDELATLGQNYEDFEMDTVEQAITDVIRTIREGRPPEAAPDARPDAGAR